MPELVLNTSEKKSVDGLCKEILSSIVRPLPASLYHYTTGAGLLGILGDAEIRATNIAYLNDSTEYLHSIDLLITAGRHFDGQVPDEQQDLLSKLWYRLSTLDRREPPAVYVACFSEARDQLSQWRGYGGGESGFCLQFDGPGIARLSAGLLLPCIYELEAQYRLVREVVERLLNIFADHAPSHAPGDRGAFADALLDYALWNLSFLAPAFKHEAFHEEREWRLVLNTPDTSRIHFVAKRTMISGYIPILLKTPDTGGMMPLTGVMVGPSPSAHLSKAAVRARSQQLGYQQLTVTESAAPFRTT